jgi:hypothetical protein
MILQSPADISYEKEWLFLGTLVVIVINGLIRLENPVFMDHRWYVHICVVVSALASYLRRDVVATFCGTISSLLTLILLIGPS